MKMSLTLLGKFYGGLEHSWPNGPAHLVDTRVIQHRSHSRAHRACISPPTPMGSGQEPASGQGTGRVFGPRDPRYRAATAMCPKL